VYDKGIDAFSPDGRPVNLGSSGVFSAPWAFRTALRVVSPTVHRRMLQVAKVAGLTAAAFAILLLLLARHYNRTVLYGMAVLIAAVPGLVLAALGWLLVQVIFGTASDPLIGGTSDIARDVAWYLVVSYLIFVGIAIGLIALGLVAERIADVVGRPADPASSAEYRGGRQPSGRAGRAIDRP
jgi:hypothetical protein